MRTTVRRRWLSAALLALSAAGCGGDRGPARLATPVGAVLLVTLDTTRADRLGAYGYRQASTPTFDRLAREGILFESAIAPAPITLPSHASILTGVYPSAHGV
ncbi:MAG: sulfatase-like hydrolase/transferase, partial [Myxococcota bacterium]